MKIRNRLSLLFTALTAAILLVFAGVVYLSAVNSRETEFYSNLKKEAVTKANLLLNARVDAMTLQTIYRNNRGIISEVEVAIFDTAFQLLYHDAVDIDFVKEDPSMLASIRQEQEIRFYQKDWQVVGMLLPHAGRSYIITAAAFDNYGFEKLYSLRRTILLVFIGSILVIYFAGRFFSNKALAPVRSIINKVQAISVSNLDLRIAQKGKDEIAELATTFNQMLDRLERSFQAQKEFVSNVSHELRTPVTALQTELQLATQKERTPEEYQAAIALAVQDTQKLARLINSLLDFARADYDRAEISFQPLRLDEIVMDARAELLKRNPDYRIPVHLGADSDDDRQVTVNGNAYLLRVACINLMDNGCKYSGNNKCVVTINSSQGVVFIHFLDEGIGIVPREKESIFKPFQRGTNAAAVEGHGIGLSLTKKIVDLHQGSLSLDMSAGGSHFIISLPNLCSTQA